MGVFVKNKNWTTVFFSEQYPGSKRFLKDVRDGGGRVWIFLDRYFYNVFKGDFPFVKSLHGNLYIFDEAYSTPVSKEVSLGIIDDVDSRFLLHKQDFLKVLDRMCLAYIVERNKGNAILIEIEDDHYSYTAFEPSVGYYFVSDSGYKLNVFKTKIMSDKEKNTLEKVLNITGVVVSVLATILPKFFKRTK